VAAPASKRNNKIQKSLSSEDNVIINLKHSPRTHSDRRGRRGTPTTVESELAFFKIIYYSFVFFKLKSLYQFGTDNIFHAAETESENKTEYRYGT